MSVETMPLPVEQPNQTSELAASAINITDKRDSHLVGGYDIGLNGNVFDTIEPSPVALNTFNSTEPNPFDGNNLGLKSESNKNSDHAVALSLGETLLNGINGATEALLPAEAPTVESETREPDELDLFIQKTNAANRSELKKVSGGTTEQKQVRLEEKVQAKQDRTNQRYEKYTVKADAKLAKQAEKTQRQTERKEKYKGQFAAVKRKLGRAALVTTAGVVLAPVVVGAGAYMAGKKAAETLTKIDRLVIPVIGDFGRETAVKVRRGSTAATEKVTKNNLSVRRRIADARINRNNRKAESHLNKAIAYEGKLSSSIK